jgi:hypothetical protein
MMPPRHATRRIHGSRLDKKMTTTETTPPKRLTMRPGEEIDEDERQERRQLSSELAAIFGGLDRLVTLLRVYPMGHPLVYGFASQLAARLNAAIEQHGPLTVQLGASDLSTDWGAPFFSQEGSERDHFIWFQSFSDGLAALTFEAGITAEELERLMMIINRADLRRLPPDDDTVTVLWEAALSHVEATSLDGFVDAGGGAILGELTEPQARTLVVQASIMPSSPAATRLIELSQGAPHSPVDSFTRHHARDATQLIAKNSSQTGAAEMAEALRVDPAWLERLMGEWTAGADLEYRLVEALLSIIRTSPGSAAASRAADTIVQLTTQLFTERAWPSVISLVRLLRARQALFKGGADPLAEILALASDPLQLEALIFLCQKDRAAQPQLIELLSLLDHALVQRQLLRSLADEKKELRAPDAIVAILFAVTDEQTQLAWCAEELMSSAIYLTRMVQALRGKPLGPNVHAASRILAAALKSSFAPLRRDALLAYSAEWGSQTILERDVEPMMSDRDEEVRQLAMDLLRRERPQSFLARLDLIIEQADFTHRQPGELRFILKHYLELRPGCEAKLLVLLDTKGWFSAERRHVATSVARLLIELGDASTIAFVRQQAASIWVAPSLRNEYRRLLARAGHHDEADKP